jgi:D-3-phosphoglycerate dehydrogenase
MRLLVVDAFPKSALEDLRALGLEVEHKTGLDEAGLESAVRDANILVVRSTVISAKVIAAATKLNLIVRAGAGVNTIDVRAASERAIYVANCPGKNATAVAELTMGLILALDRRITDAASDLRAGKWNKKEFSKAAGLHGRTIGIAGLGSIGKEVLARASAFGLIAHGWSRSLTPDKAEELGVAYASSLEQLASRVDILTLHVPLSSGTKKIVGREVLEAMKDGAMLINTSRSEVVDEAALRDAIAKKKLRVGVDVFEGEPSGGEGQFSSPLVALPGVVGTPHIGASTDQAQTAIARETVRIVQSFLAEGTAPNVVNIAAASPARAQLVVRHLDRVGVLANVLAIIKRHNINVKEVSNTIFEGAPAACAKMRLAEKPTEECLKEINAVGDVLHIDCVAVEAGA